MNINDLIFSICIVVLVISVIPMIVGPKKPSTTACLLTAIPLTAISMNFLALGLYWSALFEAIQAIEWFIVAYQSSKQPLDIVDML